MRLIQATDFPVKAPSGRISASITICRTMCELTQAIRVSFRRRAIVIFGRQASSIDSCSRHGRVNNDDTKAFPCGCDDCDPGAVERPDQNRSSSGSATGPGYLEEGGSGAKVC